MDTYKVNWPETQSGPWSIKKFTVPKNSIAALRYAFSGRAIPPGDYTRLYHKERGVVMSDTPAEIRDMIRAIRAAEGRVLVNGLGLGVYLMAIGHKDEVEHIDVVEIDQDIISMVEPLVKKELGEKITIHHADAYKMKWNKEARWSYAWHDIWDALCIDNLKLMTKLHQKYGRRVEKQDSWGKSYLMYKREREQREQRRWSVFDRALSTESQS